MAERNDLMMRAVAAEFMRNYAPSTSFGNVFGMFMLLPGLRAFWPTNMYWSAGVNDQSGNAFHLTRTNTPMPYRQNLAPYFNLNGSNQCMYHTPEADFDITGGETYVSYKGFTMGGWWFAHNIGSNTVLMSKGDGLVSNTAWWLAKYSDEPRLLIPAGDGVNFIEAASTKDMSLNTWHWVVGRYSPSTEVAVFVDDVKTTNTTSVPATVLNSSAYFTVGSYNGGTAWYFDGACSMLFFCHEYVPDGTLRVLYHHSRALFGV